MLVLNFETVLQDNPMKIVHCESSKAPLFRVVNNKQLMSAATTVHWTPVSRYVQLTCLAFLSLRVVLYLILMMTQRELNLCVRVNRNY